MVSKGTYPKMALFQVSSPFLLAGKGPAKEKISGLVSGGVCFILIYPETCEDFPPDFGELRLRPGLDGSIRCHVLHSRTCSCVGQRNIWTQRCLVCDSCTFDSKI